MGGGGGRTCLALRGGEKFTQAFYQAKVKESGHSED